jgi:hypothetical protein
MKPSRDIFSGIVARAATQQMEYRQVRGKLPPSVAIDILKTGVAEQAPISRKDVARKVLTRKNLAVAASARLRGQGFIGKLRMWAYHQFIFPESFLQGGS